LTAEQAIDEELVNCHLGTLESFESPWEALHALMLWHQSVGEYFAKKDSRVMWIKTLEQRPEEGQEIFYYFEPFESYHAGKYDSESDSVCGKSGFTTVIPEVPYWMAITSLPDNE